MWRSPILHPAGGVAPRNRNSGGEPGESTRMRLRYFWVFCQHMGFQRIERQSLQRMFPWRGRASRRRLATSLHCKIRT